MRPHLLQQTFMLLHRESWEGVCPELWLNAIFRRLCPANRSLLWGCGSAAVLAFPSKPVLGREKNQLEKKKKNPEKAFPQGC